MNIKDLVLTKKNLHFEKGDIIFNEIANNKDFVNRILVTLARRLEETDLSFTLLFKLISKSSKP
ncbi:MAG: hypothetical protein MAG551_01215 [Candidatus Scalindua arabica]|uniref:Uncharacterized protein n=1 Tax=Candidatus Scalindua arabica TaxID=1127984 RepID=A0A941W226_9BACT|nr:hypothetical protein [Candidatus Scalindua arabica]